MMKEEFEKFNENLRLTIKQEDDAKTKYSGVCKKFHDNYYENDYNGDTKFLFGSYKTRTSVRPISTDQDVDVIFKISEETFEKFDKYESNGQSALIQEVKKILEEKYTTTDKISGWGKVVLVKFSENYHNVEVLPAFEQSDNTFLIPNSDNGGSWESFDPRSQIEEFQTSNTTTNGLTAELCRMVKSWVKNTATLDYKSYEVVDDVIDFLDSEFEEGTEYEEYHEVVKNFLDYLKSNCDSNITNHVNTAYDRSVKAIEFMDSEKPKEASEEWIKIFGDLFPKVKENPPKQTQNRNREIKAPVSPWSILN